MYLKFYNVMPFVFMLMTLAFDSFLITTKLY